MSKIRELSAIDFDSTIAKFPVAELWDDHCHSTVYHLGNGSVFASSQRALDHYESCVLVDPVLEFEDERHWPLPHGIKLYHKYPVTATWLVTWPLVMNWAWWMMGL